MPFPYLAFCPYLAVNDPVEFGDWELGPLAAFEKRWADLKFKKQAKAFLAKFIDGLGRPIERPSLLCRRQGKIDGTSPSPQEIEALTAAITFAFLDKNPRRLTSLTRQQAWTVVTTDNTEPFFWPIDLDSGDVTVTTGRMVKTSSYQMSDEHLTIRHRWICTCLSVSAPSMRSVSKLCTRPYGSHFKRLEQTPRRTASGPRSVGLRKRGGTRRQSSLKNAWCF